MKCRIKECKEEGELFGLCPDHVYEIGTGVVKEFAKNEYEDKQDRKLISLGLPRHRPGF